MTSSELPEFYLSPEFSRNLKQAGKTYPNRQQAADFRAAVEAVIQQVMADPLVIVTTGALA